MYISLYSIDLIMRCILHKHKNVTPDNGIQNLLNVLVVCGLRIEKYVQN